MEKYRKFSDLKTNKNPFLPISDPLPHWKLILQGIFLVPIRLFSLFVHFLFTILCIKVLGKDSYLQKKIEQLSTYFLLIIFGIRLEVDGEKTQERTLFTANSSSYLDVFILKKLFKSSILRIQNSNSQIEYVKDNSALGDYCFAFNHKAPLKTQCNKHETVIIKDQLQKMCNQTIFFERMRTNNLFVQEIDNYLLYDLFKTLKDNKFDLTVIKLIYSNKSHCNASDHWLIHLLKSLSVITNKIIVKTKVLKNTEISVIDQIKLTMNKLYYQEEPFLLKLNSTPSIYQQFLEFYGKNKQLMKINQMLLIINLFKLFH